jgi:hypothetical protein
MRPVENTHVIVIVAFIFVSWAAYLRMVMATRCVWLTTLPPSYADYIEILEPQPPGTPRARPGL